MQRLAAFVLLNLITLFVFAQGKPGLAAKRFTINGYVKDSLSAESIIGATISISPASGFNSSSKGVSSNQYGFYSITLDSGLYSISITHVSYQSKKIELDLNSDQSINFDLVPKSAAIAEVIVFANRRRDANVKSTEMGKIDLSTNRIKNIPAFMGEVDILKAIQLLPGVRNAGEGNAGFYVRGGGPDQNLIMLDDAVVYNTGHHIEVAFLLL